MPNPYSHPGPILENKGWIRYIEKGTIFPIYGHVILALPKVVRDTTGSLGALQVLLPEVWRRSPKKTWNLNHSYMLRNCTFLGIIEAKIWIKQTKNHTPSTVIKDNSNFESLNTELKGNLVSLLKLRETEDFCCKQRVLRHKFFIYISRFSNTLSNIIRKNPSELLLECEQKEHARRHKLVKK